MEFDNKEKYPKSKHNIQCITPCFKKGIYITHPISLRLITNTEEPFCATNEWLYTDPKTGVKEEIEFDTCYKKTTQL